jgi:asparagine synthase (glutamine-hydrolysing)
LGSTFTGDGHADREDEYLEQLEALVKESVKLRLVSDVPLGAFLSGGIDSSAVVAAMADTCAGRVVTTTVGFDESGFNELEYARTVARHLGVEQHETIVRPDVADLLPRLAWHFDEPFGDSSAVPTYYVSKAAREQVTVALSGDGGDELWAGYGRHRVERWELTARRWLGPIGGMLAGRLGRGIPLSVKGARSVRHLALPPAEACARKHAYGLFEADARTALYSRDFATAVRHGDPLGGLRAAYHACSSKDPLDRALYVDVKTYLVDDILTKVDKMSMAVSLEARAAADPSWSNSWRPCRRLSNSKTAAASICFGGCSSAGSRERLSIGPSKASKHRSASGCVARWRRRWTRCCSTGGCATAGSSTTAPSPASGTSTASEPQIIATGSGAS